MTSLCTYARHITSSIRHAVGTRNNPSQKDAELRTLVACKKHKSQSITGSPSDGGRRFNQCGASHSMEAMGRLGTAGLSPCLVSAGSHLHPFSLACGAVPALELQAPSWTECCSNSPQREMLVPSFCGINCFLGLPLFILHWPTALYRSSRAQHPMANQCKGHYFPPFGGGRCPRYLASGVENMGSGMGKHDRYRRTPLLGFIVFYFYVL